MGTNWGLPDGAGGNDRGGVCNFAVGQAHNLKAAGSNPAPATKNTRLIKDFKAEHNARLLSFQTLVNAWSTF